MRQFSDTVQMRFKGRPGDDYFIEVPAILVGKLAVHENEKNAGYSITHAATGYAIIKTIASDLKDVLACARALAPFFDDMPMPPDPADQSYLDWSKSVKPLVIRWQQQLK